MTVPYSPPTYEGKAFNCVTCKAYSYQSWIKIQTYIPNNHAFYQASTRAAMSRCSHCEAVAIWYDERMVVPDASGAPQPHEDMPLQVKSDFEEAASVLQRSPRSAAALLRLSLQKLCKELGEKGDSINSDIASLVQKGLPTEVQQSLDIIRVVGNEQVHPGELDVRDDPDIAVELFHLINFIVEDRITRPKRIKSIYDRLPAKKLGGIERRDA